MAELEERLGMYLGRHPGLVDELAAKVMAHASGGLAIPAATGNRKWLFARVEQVACRGRLGRLDGLSSTPVVAEARKATRPSTLPKNPKIPSY